MSDEYPYTGFAFLQFNITAKPQYCIVQAIRDKLKQWYVTI